jgi:hypothetical protein
LEGRGYHEFPGWQKLLMGAPFVKPVDYHLICSYMYTITPNLGIEELGGTKIHELHAFYLMCTITPDL